MRKVDLIIVGQGIAGTNLAYFAEQKELDILVFDNDHRGAASMVAAGLVNPLTGRKYVKSWMIDDLLPFAKTTYNAMGERLGIKACTERNIFRALYGPKEENLFLSKANDEKTAYYINKDADSGQFHDKVKGALNYGCVTGGMQVHLQVLLSAYREYLIDKNQLINERFDYQKLICLERGFQYGDIIADNIIFAEGYQASKNPYFPDVNHDPAKGEVLIVHIPDAKFVDILRHKMFVIPILDDDGKEGDIYWVGAGYIWDFEDDQPSEKERLRLQEQLESILDCEYEIVAHKSAIRPCVKERRPQLHQHPLHEGLYLFSGMGTKGSSLAPYWAHQMIAKLS